MFHATFSQTQIISLVIIESCYIMSLGTINVYFALVGGFWKFYRIIHIMSPLIANHEWSNGLLQTLPWQ